jgi:hypothetical protein
LGQSTAATSPTQKVTWDSYPYYLARFGVHKSRRYHAKMSGVFQGLNDFVLAVNAVAGAGAFIALLGGKSTLVAQVLIGMVAAFSAVDNVLGFSKKSKRHFDLCRRFSELAANIEEWDATEANLRKAKARRIKIEEDEPPIKRLIDIVARNEELRATGYPPSDYAPITGPQAMFGYFVTFGMPKLDRWRDSQEARISPVAGQSGEEKVS